LILLCNEGEDAQRTSAVGESILADVLSAKISREQALGQASPKVKQYDYFFLAELLFSR
ncbi:hypothetical protein SAMN04488053_104292, partial [Alkalicoccus daliensis]